MNVKNSYYIFWTPNVLYFFRPPISVALGLSPLRYSQTTTSALCTPTTPPETDSKTTDIPDDGRFSYLKKNKEKM